MKCIGKVCERLSKLSLMHKLFDLNHIAPGDAVINFGKSLLVQHRNDINMMITDSSSAKSGKKKKAGG